MSVDLTKLDAVREEVETLNRTYEELYGLMFTNERNLSDAGRGVIAELKRRGMRQRDAVRILGISTAGASLNWNAI